MQNLTARILTASVLGGFVVLGTLHLPAAVMTAFYALVGFGAALEFARLAGFAQRGAALVYAISVLLLAAALGGPDAGANARGVLLAGSAWWCVAAAWVMLFQWRGAPALHATAALALVGYLCLVPALCALRLLLARDPALLLALFALVWSADIFAYAGGRSFGRHKLASRVSPGKTWEGFATALAGTLVVAVAGAGAMNLLDPPAALLLGAAILLASVIGDLLESLLKRLRGVKDSGTLLPGHGGLLDRVDSLLAAAPLFALGLMLAGRL